MRRWMSVAAAALVTSSLGAQQSKSAAKGTLDGLDAYVETVRTAWGIPGLAVSIVKDDSLVYAKGFGVRELGKPDPVDAHTIFSIGSNTKSFTSLAAAILVDDGKLSWDDKAITHYPGFQLYDPYVTREITIRDLLSHRSGLGRRGDALWYGTNYSRAEIIRRIRHLEPNAGFRTEMGYQNIMFLVAGEIVGKVSGLGWDGFVQQRIFAPLGMTRSSTTLKSLPRQTNVSTPHALWTVADLVAPAGENAGTPRTIPWRDIDNVGPAGSITSSVAEMANYVRMHLNNGTWRGTKIVGKGPLDVTKTPHINTGGAGDSVTHFSSYGLGWVLLDYRGKKIAWHNGGIDGMLSEMWTVPEAGLGVVVLTNGSPHSAGPSIVRHVIDRYLVGAPTRDWHAEAIAQRDRMMTGARTAQARLDSSRARGTSPSLPLARFAGTYADDMYGDVVVSVQADRLVFDWAGRHGTAEHWHFNTFRGGWGPGDTSTFLTFELDARGRPSALNVSGITTFRARPTAGP